MRNALSQNFIRRCWRCFFSLPILLLACVSKPTEPLKNPARFAEVYAKILIANEISSDSPSPKLGDNKIKLARADSVLRLLGFDRQQFEAAVKYFSENPERWQKVYTQIVKILEQETMARGEKQP